MPEIEIHRLVKQALDLGINHFDTAVPSSYGDSELILGRALKEVPRDQYTLSTKFAVTNSDTGITISPEEIIQCVEKSLRNLQVEELDLLLIAGELRGHHYPRVMNDLRPTVEKLLREGKIRHVGSSKKIRR